jgi:hypothetical protein
MTNIKDIQGILRDYFENLYSNKLKNLKEMNKFLDTYDHPKLKQEDVDHLNRSITLNSIEVAIKNIPKKRSPGLDRFSLEFYQIFESENTGAEQVLPGSGRRRVGEDGRGEGKVAQAMYTHVSK